MPDENLFAADPAAPVTPAVTSATETPNPVVAPVVPPTAVVPPELAGLVGSDKKYKTVSDAMNAIPHAQTHISTLEADNARMKEELTRRATAEELLADMRNSTPAAPITPVATEVNPDVISEIVKQQIENTRLGDLQKHNSDSVVNALTTSFGDKAEEVYNKIASENGMSVDSMNALSKSSPQAVLNLIGIKTTIAPNIGLKNDVNQQSQFGGAPPAVNSRVTDYGKSDSVADGMRRAKEIVDKRLNS